MFVREHLFAIRSWWKCRRSYPLPAADYGAERRHSSSWSWRRFAGLQGFPPEQSSTAPLAQIVDIPVSGGGLQAIRPGQGSSFHFPAGVHENADKPGVRFLHASVSSSTPQVPGVCYARRCATTGAGAWFLSEPGFIIMCQSTEAFGRISYPGFARAVCTWKNVALFLYDLVSGSLYLDVWVLPVVYGTLDSSGNDFGAVDSNSEVFGLRSRAAWRRVLSRCFSFSPGCAARTRKSVDPFTSPMWLEVVMM